MVELYREKGQGRRPVSKRKVTLTIPGGITLYSEAYFLEALEPFNVNLKTFRLICKQLKVPRIQLGKVRLIDPFEFGTALKWISMVGRTDFYMHGCEEVRRGSASPSEVDASEIILNHTALVESIIAQRTADRKALFQADKFPSVAYSYEQAVRSLRNHKGLAASFVRTRNVS